MFGVKFKHSYSPILQKVGKPENTCLSDFIKINV